MKFLYPTSISSTALPLFLWMIVIFTFSSLPGSGIPYEPPVWYIIERKGAHVVEYVVLMFLAFRFWSKIFIRDSVERLLLLSGVFSLAYAMTDELHQYFVPFRGANFSDTLIDGAGILFMSAVLFFLNKRKQRNR